MKATLKPGDMFCVFTNSVKARSIRLVELIYSRDSRAVYNHAGIILNPAGTTFEALNTLQKSHISNYHGQRILIVRPVYKSDMTVLSEAEKIGAYEKIIAQHEGQSYPYRRILLHMIKPLSKFGIDGWPLVCSEVVKKYESYLEIIDFFLGANPDDLADRWRISKFHKLILEGAL